MYDERERSSHGGSLPADLNYSVSIGQVVMPADASANGLPVVGVILSLAKLGATVGIYQPYAGHPSVFCSDWEELQQFVTGLIGAGAEAWGVPAQPIVDSFIAAATQPQQEAAND